MRKLLLNPTPLFRKLRQLSLLLTLLLAFPLSIWGEEVTKTFTFNKQVDPVTTGINNSSMSVSITEQVTGGSSTSSDGTVNILDYYGLLSSYSCTTNSGAVFTLKEIADEAKYFTIEIPGTYPSTPTQVTLTVAYNNSGTNTNTENAKIMVGDYGSGAQASAPPESGDNIVDFYKYYHPYRSNATSMTETTLTYTANNTSGLGTNRDNKGPLVIAVFLNGSASFTIKEATITYNRNPLDINWKLGGSVVTNASVTFGENYSLPQLDVSDGYIGDITYTSSNENVATVGNSGSVTPITSGEAVITATAPTTESFIGGTATYTLTVNKATPTMTFYRRQQTGDNNPGDIMSTPVGANETLTTTCGSTFYAPAPTFSNGHALSDSTRFVYSYSVDGVVVFPNNGEDANNPGKINYGEISLLKAGTVTITCTFPGNMQNNPCSASYKLQVDKGNAGIYFYTIENGNEEVVDNTTPAFSATYGQAFTGPAFKNPNNLTGLTWSSSPTSVAEVDNSGNVTIKFPGEATVTVTFAGNDNYNSASATYAIEVKPSAPTLSLESGVYYTNQQITATPTVTGTDLNTSLEINDGTNTSYVSISPYTYTFSNGGKFTASATTNFDLGGTLGVIPSETTTATIVINNEPTFTASVGGNAYNETNPQAGNVIVQLSVTDLQDHCTLLYYLDSDASNPQPFNVQQPITLNETTTVNAFIRYTDNSVTPNIVYDSAPTSKTYTVKQNLGITDFEPDQNYQTCYLDNGFSLNKPQGLKVYIVTGISGNSVTTTAIDYIPQGVAVLLEKDGAAPAGGYVADTYTGTAGNFAGNLLKYTGGNTSVNTTGKEYILYKNEFVKATGEISSGKCYLDLSGVSFTRGAYGIGDGSTAIDATLINNEERGNGEWYDLQGRRIQKPSKPGLYIVNGKKVVINNK